MLIPLLKAPKFESTHRYFWKWINTVFNKVDHQRIKDVGANQATAEWLLRCGASVKWDDEDKWTTDYNKLTEIADKKHLIAEIDATDSCIMSIGFYYLEGLTNLRKIRFLRCAYLDDKCMQKLSFVKNSLQNLEVISCGNISDRGVCALSDLKLLKKLYLYDLPEVKNREQCISELKLKLPHCNIDFPPVKER